MLVSVGLLGIVIVTGAQHGAGHMDLTELVEKRPQHRGFPLASKPPPPPRFLPLASSSQSASSICDDICPDLI